MASAVVGEEEEEVVMGDRMMEKAEGKAATVKECNIQRAQANLCCRSVQSRARLRQRRVT